MLDTFVDIKIEKFGDGTILILNMEKNSTLNQCENKVWDSYLGFDEESDKIIIKYLLEQ